MNTKFFCTIVVCLFCLAGCAGQPLLEAVPLSAGNRAPVAPEGMRLGASYVSALSERCFEAYPAGAPSAQAQAMCLRDGDWTLLPPIYLSLSPQGGAIASPEPGAR